MLEERAHLSYESFSQWKDLLKTVSKSLEGRGIGHVVVPGGWGLHMLLHHWPGLGRCNAAVASFARSLVHLLATATAGRPATDTRLLTAISGLCWATTCLAQERGAPILAETAEHHSVVAATKESGRLAGSRPEPRAARPLAPGSRLSRRTIVAAFGESRVLVVVLQAPAAGSTGAGWSVLRPCFVPSPQHWASHRGRSAGSAGLPGKSGSLPEDTDLVERALKPGT